MPYHENAFISVQDKEGVLAFAEDLKAMGWNIYAPERTARRLNDAGIEANNLADSRKDLSIEELQSFGIPWLGLVYVGMYSPKVAIKQGLSKAEMKDKTDIGGPTTLHSAVNARRIVLSQRQQHKPVIDWLKAGRPDEEQVLNTLAVVAEQEVALYMAESTRYLAHLALGTAPVNPYDEILRQGILSD